MLYEMQITGDRSGSDDLDRDLPDLSVRRVESWFLFPNGLLYVHVLCLWTGKGVQIVAWFLAASSQPGR